MENLEQIKPLEKKVAEAQSIDELYQIITSVPTIRATEEQKEYNSSVVVEDLKKIGNAWPLNRNITFSQIITYAPRAEGIRNKFRELLATDFISRTGDMESFVETISFIGEIPTSGGEIQPIEEEILEPLYDAIDLLKKNEVTKEEKETITRQLLFVRARLPRAYGARNKFDELFGAYFSKQNT